MHCPIYVFVLGCGEMRSLWESQLLIDVLVCASRSRSMLQQGIIWSGYACWSTLSGVWSHETKSLFIWWKSNISDLILFSISLQWIISSLFQFYWHALFSHSAQTKFQVVLTKTDILPPLDLARRATQIQEVSDVKNSLVSDLQYNLHHFGRLFASFWKLRESSCSEPILGVT
jgi:hypothetical protein